MQSFAVRNVVGEITPFLKSDALIVSVAKGIERETLKTMDQVLSECVPSTHAWGIIIGPMLAEEILQGQGAAGVYVGSDIKTITQLQSIISPHDLSLECSNDTRGVALAGVLKNIYALALGVADGVGWGANRKGWLATQAIREMREMLLIEGADPNTADGPAGLGDLIATGSSPYSRNRTTGETLVKTGEINPLSEGFISLTSVHTMLADRAQEFKIFSALYSIVVEHQDATTVYKNLV
jgi:glycerol-3-phosphate dehydrogenase (NAD(P)+)